MSYGQIGPLQISHGASAGTDILTPDVEHMTLFWYEITGVMTLHCKDSDGNVEIVMAGVDNVTCGPVPIT